MNRIPHAGILLEAVIELVRDTDFKCRIELAFLGVDDFEGLVKVLENSLGT